MRAYVHASANEGLNLRTLLRFADVSTSLVLLWAADLEHKIKEDEFAGALKAAVEAYEAAAGDFQSQKFEAALAKLRPLLARPTGAEDRRIVLSRYDRQLGRDIPVGEPRDFYPYQLAARCLLVSSGAAPDKAGTLAMLKEARGYLETSTGKCQADSSKPFLRQVNDAIARVESEFEPAGPTPAEKAVREIRRTIEAGDFAGAAAAIERQKDLLGREAEGLKTEAAKAQTRHLAAKWSEAEEFLSRFRPTRKVESLAEEMRALLPSRVTALTPEFQWVEEAAKSLESTRESGMVENARPETFDALVARSLNLEQPTLLKVAVDLRFEAVAGGVRRAVAASRTGALKDVEQASAQVQSILAREKWNRDALQKTIGEASALRKAWLERYLGMLEEKAKLLAAMAAEIPGRIEGLEEVAASLGRFDPAVFGPDASGSYEPLIKKINSIVGAQGFDRGHKEAQAAAHYLLAALLVLEGYRRGDPLTEIRRAAEGPLKRSRDLAPKLELELPLSPKVKAVLAGR
jgi:hypothetical protein